MISRRTFFAHLLSKTAQEVPKLFSALPSGLNKLIGFEDKASTAEQAGFAISKIKKHSTSQLHFHNPPGQNSSQDNQTGF
jgi:hypothetical protein